MSKFPRLPPCVPRSCLNFRGASEISRSGGSDSTFSSPDLAAFRDAFCVVAGPFLAIARVGLKTVLRVVDLSIVLVLAASPSTALFCTTWCGGPRTQMSVTEECHHHAVPSTASVAGDDTCERLLLDRMTFIREDTERLVSSSAAHNHILVSGYDVRGVAANNFHFVNRSIDTLSTRTRLSLSLRI